MLEGKGKVDFSYERKDGKERFGYQQSMPFFTDKLKLNLDSRFGEDYQKFSAGFDLTLRSDTKLSLSGSGESDAGKVTGGGTLKFDTKFGATPFQFGATGAYKTNPDAGAPPFTGSLESVVSPKIGGTTVQFGAQGFVGATPPKDGPFMSKTPLNIVPQLPLPTYTPLGNGVFFTITIPTEGTGKRK